MDLKIYFNKTIYVLAAIIDLLILCSRDPKKKHIHKGMIANNQQMSFQCGSYNDLPCTVDIASNEIILGVYRSWLPDLLCTFQKFENCDLMLLICLSDFTNMIIIIYPLFAYVYLSFIKVNF